jgi:hypothetical protein
MYLLSYCRVVRAYCSTLCWFTPPRTFLKAFADLRKATVSFFMSVPLSVRMEQISSRWTDFRENLYNWMGARGTKICRENSSLFKIALYVKPYVYLWLFWLLVLPFLPSIVVDNNRYFSIQIGTNLLYFFIRFAWFICTRNKSVQCWYLISIHYI